MHRQKREEASSGRTWGGGVCLFVNSWCAMSRRSLEVQYLMISCRPHYLPRAFLSILFVAVYLPPQNNAGTKSALNQLCKAISKQENAHPEVALLGAGDFNAGKLKSVLPHFLPACHMCNQRRKKKLETTFTPHTEMHTKLSFALHLADLTKILSS